MKNACALVLFATIFCLVVYAQEKYPTTYDNFNIDNVLKNKRLLKSYMECFMDQGPCTKEAAEAKKHLPDAFKNGCSKCSNKQKEIGKKVLKHIYEKEREWYKKLEKKYDPTGSYKKRYDSHAKREGINLQ